MELVGRETECAMIDQVVEAFRRGVSGSLVMWGERHAVVLSPRIIDYHLHEVFTKRGIALPIKLARRCSPARDGLNSRTGDFADANGTRLM